MMTTDSILAMLRASVAAAYGDADALTLGADAESGTVVICAPMTQPTAPVWAIAVRPGPAPLEIEVLGDLPVEDSRFQQAIGDPLGRVVSEPELLDSRELALLGQLREGQPAEAHRAF